MSSQIHGSDHSGSALEKWTGRPLEPSLQLHLSVEETSTRLRTRFAVSMKEYRKTLHAAALTAANQIGISDGGEMAIRVFAVGLVGCCHCAGSNPVSSGSVHIELPGAALVSVKSGAGAALVLTVLESLRR